MNHPSYLFSTTKYQLERRVQENDKIINDSSKSQRQKNEEIKTKASNEEKISKINETYEKLSETGQKRFETYKKWLIASGSQKQELATELAKIDLEIKSIFSQAGLANDLKRKQDVITKESDKAVANIYSTVDLFAKVLLQLGIKSQIIKGSLPEVSVEDPNTETNKTFWLEFKQNDTPVMVDVLELIQESRKNPNVNIESFIKETLDSSKYQIDPKYLKASYFAQK